MTVEKKSITLEKVVYLYGVKLEKFNDTLNDGIAGKVALQLWKGSSSEIKKFLFKISIRESLQLEVEQLG